MSKDGFLKDGTDEEEDVGEGDGRGRKLGEEMGLLLGEGGEGVKREGVQLVGVERRESPKDHHLVAVQKPRVEVPRSESLERGSDARLQNRPVAGLEAVLVEVGGDATGCAAAVEIETVVVSHKHWPIESGGGLRHQRPLLGHQIEGPQLLEEVRAVR